MRLVLLCAMSAALVFAARNNADPAGGKLAELTIVLDFEGAYSDESLGEMKRGAETILNTSGFAFDWRLRSEVGHSAFPNLILVKLNGECRMEPSGQPRNARGPLAFAHTTGTAVMRFADIQCDAVSSLVRWVTGARGHEQSNLLLGRALGRVLAHELCHILGNTLGHGANGVVQPAFSGGQLISGRLGLDPADLDRLQFRSAKLEE